MVELMDLTHKLFDKIFEGTVDFAIRVNGNQLGTGGALCVMLPEIGSAPELLLTIKFPGIQKALAALTPFGQECRIEVFTAVQFFSITDREDTIQQERHVLEAVPFSFRPAEVHSGDKLPGSLIRYHVTRYNAYVDNEPVWEIDAPNRKCVINGVDYSKEVFG